MLSKRSKLLYPIRIVTHVFRLPKYVEFFETKESMHSQEIAEILSELTILQESYPGLDGRIVGLQHRIASLKPAGVAALVQTKVNDTISDNHDFDYFYKLFEDNFRGTEIEIKKRIIEHLPLFKKLSPPLKKLPIIDIGCGRGEFLSVMQENGFKAVGIDMNESMIERAVSLGYDAVLDDASSYLSKQETSSIGAITGFHIVEHIPFDALLRIFEECYRTIAPGGFALFETPNPETLNVGSNTFYLDPSHRSPIPPPLLSFMLKSVGFKTRIVYLHPVRDSITNDDPLVEELYNKIYGPGDYAVIAVKP